MDFTKAALIVIDINRTHFDQELHYLPVSKEDGARILKLVPEVVIPQFRKHSRPVVFVQTIHRQDPRTREALSKKSPFWQFQMEKKRVTGCGGQRKALAVEGSAVVELMPQLERRPEDLTVVKQRYSPFYSTDMEMLLRSMEVDTLFLVGANTNNCVLATAFEAFNRDFKVVLVEDCCASMNGAFFHQLGVEQVRASLGWVVTSGQVGDILDGEVLPD